MKDGAPVWGFWVDSVCPTSYIQRCGTALPGTAQQFGPR